MLDLYISDLLFEIEFIEKQSPDPNNQLVKYKYQSFVKGQEANYIQHTTGTVITNLFTTEALLGMVAPGVRLHGVILLRSRNR